MNEMRWNQKKKNVNGDDVCYIKYSAICEKR